MAKNMVEAIDRKPQSLAEIVVQAARKAAEALTDRKKAPPETVFTAQAKPPEKAKSPEPKSSPKPDANKAAPVIPIEKLDAFKATIGEAATLEIIVQKVAEKNPQFAAALGGKPVKEEVLQEILATGVMKGKTLVEIAQDVQGAVRAGRIKTNEGALFTNRVADLTKSYEVRVEASGAAGWTFFDATNPGAATSDEVKDRLRKIQRAINRDLNLANDDKWLAKQAEKLDESDLPDDEITDYIQRLRQQQWDVLKQREETEQLRHEQQRDEEFSTMWLSPEEQKRAILDPEDVFEKWIRTIYRRRSFGQEEAAQRRITLFKEFVESESFEKKYIQAHTEIFGGLTPEQQSFKLQQLQEGWSEFVERSMYVKLTASAIRDGSKDFEQAVHFLRIAGTRGWEVVYLGNNGMNGVAFDIFCDELNAATVMPDGKHVRLTPVLYQEVLTRTKNRLREGVDTYKFKYGGQGEAKVYHDDDIEHFVNVAECLADIRQKVVLAVMRGRGPGEPGLGAETPTPSFQSLAYAESIAAVMDYTRYGPEKWGYLSEGAKRKLDFIHEFSAIMGGYDRLIDQQITQMKENRALYVARRDEAITKKWGEGDSIWKETHHNWPLALRADEEYRRILLTEHGRRRFGEILEMYDVDTSVWRIRLALQKNHELYRDTHNHALGYWLRYVGDDFLKAEDEEVLEIFEHGLSGDLATKKLYEVSVVVNGSIVQPEWGEELSCYQVLEKISHVMPHRSGFMLYEQNEHQFSRWWQSDGVQVAARSLTGRDDFVDYMQVHREVSDIHYRINALSDRQGIGVIDYRQGLGGLTEEQKRVVAIAVGCSVDQLGEGLANAYLTMMDKLSQQTGIREEVLAYADPRFRQYFKRTQWIDDARLGYIEDIKNLPEAVVGSQVRPGARARDEDDAETRRYSTTGAIGGEGSPDPLVRGWNDLSTFGMKLPMMVKEAIETTDEKTLFETLNKIKRGQDPYAGNEDAILTSVAILAGHSRYGKVDNFLIDFLGLDALPNTTESKRYQGDEGLALELKDIERFKDKLDQLYSRLELYPHLKPVVEKWEHYVGLSRFTKHKDMFWFMQAKNVAFIIAGLILLEGTKEAQSSISGGSSKHPS